jgi:uncharacterized protein GlcG (DUF336 family)
MDGGILTQRSVGIDLALECARTALTIGQARGYRIAVAIADRAGHLTVLLRSDGAGPHLIDSARRKAYTAASASIVLPYGGSYGLGVVYAAKMIKASQSRQRRHL